jgi:N4-gp56 family major capsid protein
MNPGVVFDIEEDSAVGGWLDAARYQGGEKLISGEMGKFAGIRFVESTNAQTFAAGGAGGVDIYSTFIFGPEAYAFGDWGTISAHFEAPGGKGDELAQVASVGWKGFFGATLINQDGPRYLRIESSSGL